MLLISYLYISDIPWMLIYHDMFSCEARVLQLALITKRIANTYKYFFNIFKKIRCHSIFSPEINATTELGLTLPEN